MLACDGYKMFVGTVTVNPKNDKSYQLTGTWLYRPDVGYWYYQSPKDWLAKSFSPRILTDFKEEGEQ